MKNNSKFFFEIIKDLGTGFLVLNFIIVLITTIVFNSLHLNNKDIFYIILFFALPLLVSDLIYFYFRLKSKQTSSNNNKKLHK